MLSSLLWKPSLAKSDLKIVVRTVETKFEARFNTNILMKLTTESQLCTVSNKFANRNIRLHQKKLFISNLNFFIISWSVCPLQARTVKFKNNSLLKNIIGSSTSLGHKYLAWLYILSKTNTPSYYLKSVSNTKFL